MKKRPLIVVEWTDIAGYKSWHREDEVFSDGIQCFSVGWKLGASRKSVTLASTRTELADCNDVEVIPRGAIRSIRRLE